MKILMISDYFAPHIGGVEHAAGAIGRGLVARGHEVHVLTLNTDGAPPREQLDGMSIHRVPCLELTPVVRMQSAWSALFPSAVGKLIRELHPDVIHAHGLFFSTTLMASLMRSTYRCPFVVTMHQGALDCLSGPARLATAAWERVAVKRILDASDRLIAVSQAVARHGLRLGVRPESVRIVPNGVDCDRFFPAPSLIANRPRVMMVGRLISIKGPELLCNAAPGILAQHPDTEFVMVGDGPLRESLESGLAQRGIRSSFTFLGSRADIPELLRSGDILVLPSQTEGMPLVALEASASGVPVVATAVGGTPEVVRDGETGLLVAPGDAGQLTMAVNRLLTSPALRLQMGRRGREVAVSEFEWSEISDRTLAVYDEVIGGQTYARHEGALDRVPDSRLQVA